MKKLAALLIALLLLMPAALAEAPDYSFLDSMTLEELQALQAEIESRILAADMPDGAHFSSSTGIWLVDIHPETGKRFVRNAKLILGTCIQGINQKDVGVRLLIDTESVSLMVYEYYAATQIASSTANQWCKVLMTDPTGRTSVLQGYARGSLIRFDGLDRQRILNALMKNGAVSFLIDLTVDDLHEYRFAIDNSLYFANAYAALLNPEEQRVDGRLPQGVFELGPGEYVVGRDIPAGRYVVTTFSSQPSISHYYQSGWLQFEALNPARCLRVNLMQDGQRIVVSGGTLIFDEYDW